MKLKHDPFPLIFARGDEATQLACLELFDLSDSPRSQRCQAALLGQQRADGAFPSQFDPAQWGMVETVRHTLLLLSAGFPPDGANVAAAIRFLLDRQNTDGGWCENSALPIPAERTWLSSERSISWVTADAIELLRRAGLEQRGPCQRALAGLKKLQNHDGGWPSLAVEPRTATSDPDTTAQIAFLMGEIYGPQDPAFLRGRALFEQHLDECASDVERGYWVPFRGEPQQPLDAYLLTHLLLSSLVDVPRRFKAGYNVADRRVKRITEALVEIQGEDGGWSCFWTPGSSAVYTVLALGVLVESGALPRQDLEPIVQVYAAGPHQGGVCQ